MNKRTVMGSKLITCHRVEVAELQQQQSQSKSDTAPGEENKDKTESMQGTVLLIQVTTVKWNKKQINLKESSVLEHFRCEIRAY